MIELQAISKVLQDRDIKFLLNAGIQDKSFFEVFGDEFNFIKDHYDKYGNVPDPTTILDKFPDFELVRVDEDNKYIIDKLREERLYRQVVQVINESAEKLNLDANLGVDHLLNSLENLEINYGIQGKDIIQQATERYDELIDKKSSRDSWFFDLNLPELNQLLHGIQRREELILVFARTNEGKSWFVQKLAESVWSSGYNVGYFSPEMTANRIGYRFDTLHKNFSNRKLTTADTTQGEDMSYFKYIQELSKSNAKFLVTTPADFNNWTTISKLRAWVKENDLSMLIVDGLTYMADERARRQDNDTIRLGNISADLMSLSIELSIPIIMVMQANRSAVADGRTGAPKIQDVRGSDAPAQHSSRVLSIRNKNGVLEIECSKDRYGDAKGRRILYAWEIDTGSYLYMPNEKSGLESDNKVIEEQKREFDNEDVF